jgi:Protein of unknown function (DUF4236)
MGWSFRRSKSFGLFRLTFSKSGLGFSFGVRGARIGVNAKGKKYVRGSISGTGLYYQSSLPDAQPGEAPQSTTSVSRLGILVAVLVVGLLIHWISSSTPTTSAPVAPVPQTVAPVAAPVTPKHVVRKHKRKHAAHRAPATTKEPDAAPVAESDVTGGGDVPSR